MQTFGEMDTGYLKYLFRELGVTYSFPPNVHFPRMPICPGAHLTQILIFPNSQFALSPHLFRCPFAPSAFLPFVRCPCTPVPICLKCPFAPSVRLLQILHISKCPFIIVPIISPNPHLPRSPFPPNTYLPQEPNSPGPKCLGPSICLGPILSNSVPCSLIDDFLRFYSI